MHTFCLIPVLTLSVCATGNTIDTSLAQSRAVTHAARKETVFDFASLVPPRASDAIDQTPPPIVLERVSAMVPWARGLALVDGELIALSRGRHRIDGGVSDDLVDHAGRLWRIDTNISEVVVLGEPAGEAVRVNGTIFADPTSPPFHVYDHSSPPEGDTLMDRPYCGLAFDPVSRNLFVCAFAGAELDGGSRFRKHGTDAILRYDLRDGRWRTVERHDHTVVPRSGDSHDLGRVISNEFYPHHDPSTNAPPHGWVNGPTDCAAVGDFMYVTAKDNHLLVQYDLHEIRRNPDAAAPTSRAVLGPLVTFRLPDGTLRELEILGHAGVASDGTHLYVGSRTSSVVFRVPIDARGDVILGEPAELIAIFEPWDAEAARSGNLFDLTIGPDGAVYVSMSRGGRVWRIVPDPRNPFLGDDRAGRETTAAPFIDLPKLLGKRAGAADIAIDDEGRVYVCARTNDVGDGQMSGTIYRAVPQR